MKDTMSQIFPDILDVSRQQVFSQLSTFQGDGYLAGGTALALQLAHRISFDFDVFTYHPVTSILRSRIGKKFSITTVHVNSEDQYTFTSTNGIEITFVWFDVRLLQPLIPTSSLSLASIPDIAANKANTLGLRATWRDYVDLFWLLHVRNIPIEHIVTWATQKYAKQFDAAQFFEQLIYFEDLTITPVQFVTQSFTTEEIKESLKQSVSAYVKRHPK